MNLVISSFVARACRSYLHDNAMWPYLLISCIVATPRRNENDHSEMHDEQFSMHNSTRNRIKNRALSEYYFLSIFWKCISVFVLFCCHCIVRIAEAEYVKRLLSLTKRTGWGSNSQNTTHHRATLTHYLYLCFYRLSN